MQRKESRINRKESRILTSYVNMLFVHTVVYHTLMVRWYLPPGNSKLYGGGTIPYRRYHLCLEKSCHDITNYHLES